MKCDLQFDGFILAGGVSSRMGKEKGALEFGGVPLIVRTAQLVKPFVNRVIVVGPPERHISFGLCSIPDRDFGIQAESGESKGPLIGIATALFSAQSPWNLILACDLPYLTADWLKWLLARAARSNAMVLIPQTSRGLEPLAAVYRRECATVILQSLARGDHKVTDSLRDLLVEPVSEIEWSNVAPEGLVLKNMNTRADYEEARQWWDSERSHRK